MFFHINKLTFSRTLNAVLIVSLAILCVLQIHNAISFPISRGFDANPHSDYIRYLQEKKSLPTARDGWEMYQPPLYYAVASVFPSLNMTKVIGLLGYFVLIGLSYLTFSKLYRSVTMGLMGSLIVASTPVVIYLTPTIGNEFFSAVLISVAAMYYLLHPKLNQTRTKIILGILMGLALGAKATGLILIVSIVIDRLWTHRHRLKLFVSEMMIPLLLTIVVGGSHYIRNTVLFGNPLVAPSNLKYLFPHLQGIVPRNIQFFTDPKGFLQLDMFRSHHYSFWSGTYFSWFYDAHNVIVPVQQFSKAGALLILASIPIFIGALIGFYLSWRARTRNVFPLVYVVLLFVGYIFYNFRLPYYSTVKGAFLISSVFFVSYFFLQFLKKYQSATTLAIVYLFCYTILIVKNFWILSFWYK